MLVAVTWQRLAAVVVQLAAAPPVPPLPRELQYRFLFRDLALVDVHANLVVDILPDALGATEF